jgi:predicted HD superfamily hydrolase involved in NAD metabolism
VSDVRYEDAAAAIEARLGHKSAKHCRRVAATAAALAVTYGVDADAAQLAGLLHDWDREVAPQELLAEAKRAGIAITPADEANPHLLHARTGALAARQGLPGLSDDVVQAISRHTVGDLGMTPLDMVVYVADMIEPHRDFAGAQELRDAVGAVSLAELFALSYQQSMSHIVDARKRMHPQTVAVWNALVAGEPR